MENSFKGLKSSIEEAEERVCKLEDRSTVIIRFEVQKEKRMKKNKQTLEDLWDTINQTNIAIMGTPKGEDKEKETERIDEDITD